MSKFYEYRKLLESLGFSLFWTKSNSNIGYNALTINTFIKKDVEENRLLTYLFTEIKDEYYIEYIVTEMDTNELVSKVSMKEDFFLEYHKNDFRILKINDICQLS